MFKAQAAETLFLDEVVANTALQALDKVELVFQQLGQELVDYLRSFTDKTNPGWPDPTGPAREAHPGEWSDRSSQLSASYGFEVVRSADSVMLRIFNTADYAFWVQVMDGFFVVPAPGTPEGRVIDEQFRVIASRLAPDMTVIVEAPSQPEGGD